MILKRGVQHSPLGGDYISSQIRALFKKNSPQPITITPHYLISSKTAVEAGQPPQAKYRTFPATCTSSGSSQTGTEASSGD